MAPWAPPDGPRGHTIFQWGPGEAFLVQRWETSVDIAPDGVAILAVDEESEFSPGGDTIEGAWEKSDDGSSTWEHDFDLIYRRVS